MKRKPKYKVGDVLEYWQVETNYIRYVMVAGVANIDCGWPDCKACKKGINAYLLKPMDDNPVEDWSIRDVDMVGWGRIARECNFGWRKVG